MILITVSINLLVGILESQKNLYTQNFTKLVDIRYICLDFRNLHLK